MQKSSFSVLYKRVYPVSLRMHIESAEGKPASHEKISRGKVSMGNSIVLSKKNDLEAMKRHSNVGKKLVTYKSHYSFRQ